jgi:hypothetical protein
MIQWIALAVAADANSKAGQARRAADEANATSHQNQGFGSSLVILQPFDLVKKPVREATGFWDSLFIPTKKVLSDEPMEKISIRKSDLLNFKEYKDDDGKPYVWIGISEYAKISHPDGGLRIAARIPGTLEEVTAAIGGL